MYLLKDLIEIDKRFQSSINLQLDLENDKKIESYIPTRSSMAILEMYLENVAQRDGNRATILIGPYGKGKSHLLLVLLRLLSEKRPDRFLPVLISGSGTNLADAFLLGLTEALKREGLEEITPDSYYKEAIKVLKNWRQNFPDTYRFFSEKVQNDGISMEMLYERLEKMDELVLDIFRRLYPEVTAGSIFSPIVNMNIMKAYEAVNRALCKNHGYAGMFLVFDEFSKYIEGHGEEAFAHDMKIVQDMCELAMNSEEEQLHIVFVAHKSIREYGNELPKSMKNTFIGVEGRLKEVPFLVSGKNNFELVRSVLKKRDSKYRKVLQSSEDWQELLDSSYKVPCFQGLFEQNEYDEVVKYGCFPLLPMTVVLLLRISERVAQNERSIFTFLANMETGSLVYLVEKEKISAQGIAADKVYDYFSCLFRENTGMTRVHTEWLKAEYALTKVEQEKEQRAIKVLALLRMVGNHEEIPVNRETVRLASGFRQAENDEIMDRLERAGLIIWRIKSAAYSFKNNVGVDLEKEIRHVMKRQSGKFNLCEILQEVSDLEYILPKQHNQEFSITRYFHYEYMNAAQFLKLPAADYLFENKMADGKIVAIADAGTAQEEMQKKLKELRDERLVVLYPKKSFDQEENLRRLLAVRELLNNKEFLEENKVLEQELQIYEEDLIFEINAELEKVYLPEKGQCIVFHMERCLEDWSHAKEFNQFLSEICKHYYALTPKINNEMINRRILSAQTKRSRNLIIDDILKGRDIRKYFGGTSAEATIFRAAFVHTGVIGEEQEIDSGSKYVLEKISDFLESCAGVRHSFAELYEQLTGKGCGARKSVVPVFLARQLSLLEDAPVISLDEKEVVITPEVMGNIDEKPQDYYLYIEQATVDKGKYLQQLSKIFDVSGTETSGFYHWNRLTEITEAMLRWYRGLPQYTRNFAAQPVDLPPEMFREIKKLRNILRGAEPNPRELLFEKIPNIFEYTDSYLTCAQKIETEKEYLNGFLEANKKEMIRIIKQIYQAQPEDGLYSVLKAWYEEQSHTAKSYLAGNKVTGFMDYLEHFTTHSESEIAGRLAKCVLGIYLEDWTDESKEHFRNELSEIKQSVEGTRDEGSKSGNQGTISFTNSRGQKIEKFFDKDHDNSTSYFLKNALAEALDEFGDSLEVNQKVAVLVQMLEELTG